MILEQIVSGNIKELESRKITRPLARLQEMARQQPAPLDFAAALRGDSVRLIAEVKKASPSRGVIRADFDPAVIAGAYARGGAAAISVLTEGAYFQGSLGYLEAIADDMSYDGKGSGNTPAVRGELVEPQVRPSTGSGRKDLAKAASRPPLLRKDFIVDAYQVYESRAYGADALLLIASILTVTELGSLLELTHRLGMAALVEAHDEKEIMLAIESGAKVIGINNRDLKTFKVDIMATAGLRPLVPADRIVVSESGISCYEDIEYLRSIGVNAALIGEALMTAPDIGQKLKELRG